MKNKRLWIIFLLMGLVGLSVATLLGIAPAASVQAAPFVNAKIDVVFANLAGAGGSLTNRVCLGDGSGGFNGCANLSADTNESQAVALADLNDDTYLDAVFANNDSTANRVCLGDGSGGFSGCTNLSADTNESVDVALADLNGDSKLDAVFANYFGQVNRVCLGDGSGSFSGCADVSADTNESFSVALGQLNGDSYPDAVFANLTGPNRVCLNDGSGGFTSCADLSADLNNSVGVALADLNGDTSLDAVFANTNGQANQVCLGDGSGGFSGCANVSADTYDSNAVALADLNGDNNPDAVFANLGQANRVCLGNGAGGFSGCANISGDTNASTDVALADLNNDGYADAVFANDGTPNRACLGDGNGSFSGCANVSADANHSFGVALADLAPPSNPTSFSLQRFSFGSGGGTTSGSHFELNGLLGQPGPIGELQGSIFQLQAGFFWHDPADSTVTALIDPASGGILNASEGNIVLDFPTGAVTTTTTITYTPQTTPTPAVGSLTFAGVSFRVTASDSHGDPVVHFNQPFSLTLQYDDSDWINAGMTTETELNLYYWDPNLGQWVGMLPCAGCSLDTGNNILVVVLDHLTEFALLGEPKYGIYLPLVLR